MREDVRDFLRDHPLKSRWLDDCIDILMERPRGTAHVDEIAHALLASGKREKESIKEIITRRLNSFCSDAEDFEKNANCDLFQRVAPNTFHVRGFPHRPNTLDLIPVGFEGRAMQRSWELFAKAANDKFAEKWASLSNLDRLSAFVTKFNEGGIFRTIYDNNK